ncbi:MAG: putative lipid II flippase FtsW [Verrucomicrobiota bacterium]|nr:putative lipid II flippase FtsW [Verrucomicrobiota bacterium]
MITEARRIDWGLQARRWGPTLLVLFAVISLTLLGLIVLYSAGRAEATGASTYMKKQAMWLVLAIGVFYFAYRLDLERLRPLAPWIAIVALLLLIAVLVPGIGRKVNGARRWIDLGPMNMQVSDFVKIALIFVLAHYLAANQRLLDTFKRGFLIPGILFGVVFVMILLQPDYGTALLCAIVGTCMLFLAGARMLYIIPSAIIGLFLFAVAIIHDPVRIRRIMAFMDVEGNKSDSAYQLWQGILAFGAGGLGGVGLGNGRQQMAFLPEAHTDFIFPIIGEELGFFFTIGVVLAFALIFVVVVWNLRRASNLFQFLLTIGALLLIILQALINFGVVTGLLPTKGMSLPFISYGGSNLLALAACVGIILNHFRLWALGPQQRACELEV